MLPEILLETMSFLDRSSLEACLLVNRRYLGVVTKSNSALALRPMDELSVHCPVVFDADDGIVLFERHASDGDAEGPVDLKIGTDWSQLQAVAEETVARTRNMFISNMYISCVTYASPLVALWHDTFNDAMPCRAVELSMNACCEIKIDTNMQQLFQSFAASKLRVERYEIILCGGTMDECDALWSSWHRPTAQFCTFELKSAELMTNFLAQLLREPEHGGRHYIVEGYSSDVLQMVESYVQKFESGGTELNFPASLAFCCLRRQERTVHKLQRRTLRTLDKLPASNVPYRRSLWNGRVLEESLCDFYEIRNFTRRQTMLAYFWVATRRSYSFARLPAAPTEEYYHCHWFCIVPS